MPEATQEADSRGFSRRGGRALVRLRVLSSILDAYVPALLYLMAASLFSQGPDLWGTWLTGSALAAFSSGLGALAFGLGRAERFSQAAAVGSGLAIAAVWPAIAGITGFTALFVPLVAVSSLRLHLACRSREVSRAVSGAFILDSGFLLVLLPFLTVAQFLPRATSAFATLPTLMSVLYFLGRIYVLWSTERVETETAGASKAGLVVMLLSAAAFALWGLTIGLRGLMTLVALLALAGVPLLFLLPEIHSKAANPANRMAEISHLFKQRDAHAAAAHSGLYGVLAVLFAVSAAASAVALWRIWRRAGLRLPEGRAEGTGPAAIARHWVSPGGPVFAQTSDPVRLRYQEWLRKNHEKGASVRPDETPREFLRRAAEPDAPLTEGYERRRYGDRPKQASRRGDA